MKHKEESEHKLIAETTAAQKETQFSLVKNRKLCTFDLGKGGGQMKANQD